MAVPSYDLVVLGAGAAGLTAAGLGASFGAKTLLVERDRPGGDCTWTGCVPSKTLLRAAHVAHLTRTASRCGLADAEPEVPFPRIIRHVHAVRQEIYEDADSPEALAEFGVEVWKGDARFRDPHHVEIETPEGSRTVHARFVVIATGGRPVVPDVEGLEEAGYLTSDSLFEIERLPRRLVVVGAGPVGMEMSQAFRRLGAEVTVVSRGERPLSRDDPDHARRLQALMEGEGIRFHLGATVEAVRREGEDRVVSARLADGSRQQLRADAVLVAIGRRPNTEGLGLVEARVAFTEEGVRVDERCRTSNRHIYAVGDVTGEYQLTHMGEHMAKVALSNAILKIPAKLDRDHVPWVTFTDPELACLGASEAELKEAGTAYEVYRFPYEKMDRAITESVPEGEVKVFATRWRGKILGASVLGERAGELVSLYAVAMRNGVTLRQISDTIFPYPTYGLGARRAADQWYARKQFPWAVRTLQRLFRYRGPTPQAPDPERIV
jgi:pyruvate/2-oxoglutarate dehydrogenase complex dihydrolipoamide dehydrogenase (E3) component